MTRTKRTLPLSLLALLALALLAVPASADGSFTGSFMLGYRSVDTGGTLNKYKEDVNLDEGPRLFGLEFAYVPDEGNRKAIDRVELRLTNYGGDPFETLGLSIEKFGKWSFDFDRMKSDYFYNDIILPVELAGDPALALAGDFHHFDFTRVRDRAKFKVRLNPRAKLHFGLDRFTKRGESTTTLDVSRDEFELDQPVDESYNSYFGGFEYSWDKVTLVVEERIRDYENVIEIFLPGQSLGEDPEDATILDFFFFDRPYDYSSNETTVRLNARPSDKLTVRLSGMVQSLDMDFTGDQRGKGIAFTGAPLAIDAEGGGEVERDLDLFDVDLTYMVNDKLAITGGMRRYDLDQTGNVEFGGAAEATGWVIETTGYELGANFFVSPKVTVAVGLIEEERDVEFSLIEEGDLELDRDTTDHTGTFAKVNWRPVKNARLSLGYEDSSFDNPYTLVSPTDRERIRLQGSLRLDNGVNLSGNYSTADFDNATSGWRSSQDRYGLRVGYTKDGLTLSVGTSAIEVDRAIDQVLVTLPGFGGGQMIPFPILYTADAEFVDAIVRYRADRFTCGAELRTYTNDGSFALDRDDFRGYVEFDIHDGYVAHVGYRTVDYDEAAFNFDDYDADIIELSVGYRWK